MKFFTRKRTQPINYANIFCLWHIYRAIGEEVPVVIAPGGYEDDENDLMTTKHRAISYRTEPMTTQQFEKVKTSK